jgi:hypothetical protein
MFFEDLPSFQQGTDLADFAKLTHCGDISVARGITTKLPKPATAGTEVAK